MHLGAAGAVRDRIEGIKSNHAHIYGRDGRADRKNAIARESQVHAHSNGNRGCAMSVREREREGESDETRSEDCVVVR